MLLISAASPRGTGDTQPYPSLSLCPLNPLLSLYLLASSPLFSVFPASLRLVMPHCPTAFRSSFFSLSHTSISLCTLNLSTFFFFFPVPLTSLRWSHTGSCVMTHVVYSVENTVYSSLRAILLGRNWEDGGRLAEGGERDAGNTAKRLHLSHSSSQAFLEGRDSDLG